MIYFFNFWKPGIPICCCWLLFIVYFCYFFKTLYYSPSYFLLLANVASTLLVNRRWRSLNNLKPEFTGRPTVNILICHYQEDIDDTRRTFASCLNLVTDGKVKVNIFICDDGFFENKGSYYFFFFFFFFFANYTVLFCILKEAKELFRQMAQRWIKWWEKKFLFFSFLLKLSLSFFRLFCFLSFSSAFSLSHRLFSNFLYSFFSSATTIVFYSNKYPCIAHQVLEWERGW